jgi:hypothetical protein
MTVPNNTGRNVFVLLFLRSVLKLVVITNVVGRSLILSALMMELIRSSDPLVLTRATRRNIPEDGILHNHRPKNQKSYIIWKMLRNALTGATGRCIAVSKYAEMTKAEETRPFPTRSVHRKFLATEHFARRNGTL